MFLLAAPILIIAKEIYLESCMGTNLKIMNSLVILEEYDSLQISTQFQIRTINCFFTVHDFYLQVQRKHVYDLRQSLLMDNVECCRQRIYQ